MPSKPSEAQPRDVMGKQNVIGICFWATNTCSAYREMIVPLREVAGVATSAKCTQRSVPRQLHGRQEI